MPVGTTKSWAGSQNGPGRAWKILALSLGAAFFAVGLFLLLEQLFFGILTIGIGGSGILVVVGIGLLFIGAGGRIRDLDEAEERLASRGH